MALNLCDLADSMETKYRFTTMLMIYPVTGFRYEMVNIRL